eukprot:10425-Heterococcus_DN1.PRE.1
MGQCALPGSQSSGSAAPQSTHDVTVRFLRERTSSSTEDLINYLLQLQTSSDPSAQRTLSTLVHDILDEFNGVCDPAFSHEDRTYAAELFGNLIEHELMSGVALCIALRYVKEALDQPLGNITETETKMFSIGRAALEQFKGSLVHWPDYALQLTQVQRLRHDSPELVQEIAESINASV